ncbi:hypothetical protein RUM44_002444 [Polyplax serrata]|uniref:Uncharacterized protein n=1 Tax=Polyplax serrata TaxID=468196 RepID=A0ABR1AET3_POLSC
MRNIGPAAKKQIRFGGGGIGGGGGREEEEEEDEDEETRNRNAISPGKITAEDARQQHGNSDGIRSDNWINKTQNGY